MVTPSEEINHLRREVLHVTSETSDKYVLAPNRNQILSDLLIGLKRFRNVVRWKYFFAEKKRIEKELKDSPLSQTTYNSKFNFEKDENENTPKLLNQEGINSGLKATNNTQNAPIGSPELEGFLRELERTLITQAFEDSKTKRKRDENILLTLDKLGKSTQVTIATDKTNSFKVISIEKYKFWVYGHLEKAAKEVKDRE